MAGEEFVDFTSSYYSLVVLTTATMGLSSYIYNHYLGKFNEIQKRLNDHQTDSETRFKGVKFTDDVTKERDDIKVQRPLEILIQIALLASLLPYAALGQGFMVASKNWGQCFWLKHSMASTLILAFALCLGTTVSIMRRLNKLRKNIAKLSDRVDTNVNLAEAQYTGFINNKQPAAESNARGKKNK